MKAALNEDRGMREEQLALYRSNTAVSVQKIREYEQACARAEVQLVTTSSPFYKRCVR